MQATHPNLWVNFDVFCGTNDAWDSLRISNRVNEGNLQFKYSSIHVLLKGEIEAKVDVKLS